LEYKDYYKTLGVDKKADTKEIKSAYRKLARKYHPDVNPGDKSAEDKFKEIQEAYEVLSDPGKRSKYDTFGAQWKDAARGGAGGPFTWRSWGGAGGQRVNVDVGGDFSDFFNMLFGEDIMSGRTGFRTRPAAPRTGRDLQYEMEVSLREAFSGTSKRFTVEFDDICTECQGTGFDQRKGARTCPACNGQGRREGIFGMGAVCDRCGGTGKIGSEPCPSCRGRAVKKVRRSVEVKVPQGVQDGSKIRLKGQGLSTPHGGHKGDLYLVVKLKPEPGYERKGDDLYTTIWVPFTTAAIGGEVAVKTLDKTVKAKIPEGTQGGQCMRLKGLGMPRLKGRGAGDLYLRVRIAIPKKMTGSQREYLREFEEIAEEQERAEGPRKGEKSAKQ
jgi:molecular chaperone DnaJ